MSVKRFSKWQARGCILTPDRMDKEGKYVGLNIIQYDFSTRGCCNNIILVLDYVRILLGLHRLI